MIISMLPTAAKGAAKRSRVLVLTRKRRVRHVIPFRHQALRLRYFACRLSAEDKSSRMGAPGPCSCWWPACVPPAAHRRLRRASASRNRSASTLCARVPRRWRPNPTSRRRRLPRVVDTVDFDAVQAIKFRADRALWPAGPGACPVRLFHVDSTIRSACASTSCRTVRHASSSIRPTASTTRMRRWPASCRPTSASPDFVSWTDAARKPTGSPSRVRATSAPPARTTSTARRRAASPSTPACRRPRGISALHRVLARRAEGRYAVDHHLRAARRSEHHRRLPLRGCEGPRCRSSTSAPISIARTDIERVGVAPLTSMFWYGENDRRYASDWRPEIHDSDGLAMWTGVGEHIWRPLINSSIRAHQLVRRRNAEGLRPDAARPRLRRVSGRRRLL